MHPHGATLQNSSRSSRHPWMAHRKILYGLQPNWLGSARSRRMSRRMSQGHWLLMESWKRNKDLIFQVFWLLIDLIQEDNTSESHKFESFSLGQGTILFYRASFAWHFLGVHPINRPPEDRVLKVWWSLLIPKQNTHYSPSRTTGIAVLSKASRHRCFSSVTSIWQLEESPVGYQSSFNLMMQSPLHGNCQRCIEMLQWKLLWEASNLNTHWKRHIALRYKKNVKVHK